jgi:hypothetical protein
MLRSSSKNNPFGWSTPVLVTVTPAAVRLGVSCWKPVFPYDGNYQCTAGARSDQQAGMVMGDFTYSFDSNPPISVPLSDGNAQFTIVTPSVGFQTVAIAYAQQENFAAAGADIQKFTVTRRTMLRLRCPVPR